MTFDIGIWHNGLDHVWSGSYVKVVGQKLKVTGRKYG